jgi:hypothetical protein
MHWLSDTPLADVDAAQIDCALKHCRSSEPGPAHQRFNVFENAQSDRTGRCSSSFNSHISHGFCLGRRIPPSLERLAPARFTMPIFAFLSGSRYIRRVNCPCVPQFPRAIARRPTNRR